MPRAPAAARSHEVCVTAEVQPPALRGGDAVAGAVPSLAVTVEMTVLQLDAGALRVLGDEPHLDLAALLGVRLDLRVGRDVPAEDDAVGRLVGEHSPPLALAPIGPPVVNPPAGPLLEHRLLDLDTEHVVLARLDAVHLLSEDGERPLDRRFDDDLVAY